MGFFSGAGLAGPAGEGPQPGGGPLHQQRGPGPAALLPGGAQRSEHGGRVEKGGLVLNKKRKKNVKVTDRVSTLQKVGSVNLEFGWFMNNFYGKINFQFGAHRATNVRGI